MKEGVNQWMEGYEFTVGKEKQQHLTLVMKNGNNVFLEISANKEGAREVKQGRTKEGKAAGREDGERREGGRKGEEKGMEQREEHGEGQDSWRGSSDRGRGRERG